MHAAELCERYPTLFHVTFAASWRGILDNGLWSAERLTELLGWDVPIREKYLSKRGLAVGHFEHPGLGRVTFRDHRAVPRRGFGRALQGLSEPDWYRELNRRVFLFPRRAAADALIAAYPTDPQVVISINTEELVAGYAERVDLSTINTGSALRRPAARGANTFVPLEEFSLSANRITEISLRGGLDKVPAISVDSKATRLWPDSAQS